MYNQFKKNKQKCILHIFFCCCPNGQIMWIVECGMLISFLSLGQLAPLVNHWICVSNIVFMTNFHVEWTIESVYQTICDKWRLFMKIVCTVAWKRWINDNWRIKAKLRFQTKASYFTAPTNPTRNWFNILGKILHIQFLYHFSSKLPVQVAFNQARQVVL